LENISQGILVFLFIEIVSLAIANELAPDMLEVGIAIFGIIYACDAHDLFWRRSVKRLSVVIRGSLYQRFLNRGLVVINYSLSLSKAAKFFIG
jgi:hypothetical protein